MCCFGTRSLTEKQFIRSWPRCPKFWSTNSFVVFHISISALRSMYLILHWLYTLDALQITILHRLVSSQVPTSFKNQRSYKAPHSVDTGLIWSQISSLHRKYLSFLFFFIKAYNSCSVTPRILEFASSRKHIFQLKSFLSVTDWNIKNKNT